MRNKPQPPEGFEVSPIRFSTLRPLRIAALRHVGPYEEVDPDLWLRLEEWSKDRWPESSYALLGIGHDSPAVTDSSKLRFDACITIPDSTDAAPPIRVSTLPALSCAVATHVGPYSTLPSAYQKIFAELYVRSDCEIDGLPAIEVYRDPCVDIARHISITDIHIPMKSVPPRRGRHE